MERIFEALARWVVRYKYPVAVLWIVIAIFSVRAFPSLASVTKDTNSGFLPDNVPSIQASHLVEPSWRRWASRRSCSSIPASRRG